MSEKNTCRKDRGLGFCPRCGHPMEIDFYPGLFGDNARDLEGITCPTAFTWCRGHRVPLADMTRKQRRLARKQHKHLKDNERWDTGPQRPIGHPSEHVRDPQTRGHRY